MSSSCFVLPASFFLLSHFSVKMLSCIAFPYSSLSYFHKLTPAIAKTCTSFSKYLILVLLLFLVFLLLLLLLQVFLDILLHLLLFLCFCFASDPRMLFPNPFPLLLITCYCFLLYIGCLGLYWEQITEKVDRVCKEAFLERLCKICQPTGYSIKIWNNVGKLTGFAIA